MKHIEAKNLTVDELAKVLKAIPELKAWIAAVEEYALFLAQEGTEIPGFELGTTRSSRVWPESEDIVALIALYGLDEDKYNPRVPLSVAQMEKALGKSEFAEKFGNHVGQTTGSPKLVVKP
jgi:hypothetical protein